MLINNCFTRLPHWRWQWQPSNSNSTNSRAISSVIQTCRQTTTSPRHPPLQHVNLHHRFRTQSTLHHPRVHLSVHLRSLLKSPRPKICSRKPAFCRTTFTNHFSIYKINLLYLTFFRRPFNLVITTNNSCTNQTYVPKKTQRLKFGFGFSIS